jgi:hypothetical protein
MRPATAYKFFRLHGFCKANDFESVSSFSVRSELCFLLNKLLHTFSSRLTTIVLSGENMTPAGLRIRVQGCGLDLDSMGCPDPGDGKKKIEICNKKKII